MAYVEINTRESATDWKAKDNAMLVELYANVASIQADITELFANSILKDDSLLYPGQQVHQIPGITTGTTAFEILHLGRTVAANQGQFEPFMEFPKGIVVLNWSQNWVNNWEWNNALSRSEPFDTDEAMVGFEVGGEGILCHWTKPGDVPATAFHEITRFGGGAEGVSGIAAYGNTIPYNQHKTTGLWAYKSSTTPDAATDHPWWGGSVSESIRPMIYLISEEAKGAENEYLRSETNAASASAFPAHYFAKSRGTNQTKAAVATSDVLGLIGFKGYEGDEYHVSAAIRAVVNGTVSNNTLPTQLEFQTTATSGGSRATRFTIKPNGVLNYASPPTSASGLSAGDIWNNSGVLTVV